MGIYQKLATIQSQLFVPKGQRNQFGGFNYRSCEDILKVVKPIAHKEGCVIFLDNKMTFANGEQYIEATASLFDTESGEHVSVSAQAREEKVKKGMDAAQISGSTSSYARKYALAGLFAIDNETDPDGRDHDGNIIQSAKPAPSPAVTPAAKTPPENLAKTTWFEYLPKAKLKYPERTEREHWDAFKDWVTKLAGAETLNTRNNEGWKSLRKCIANNNID